MITPLYEAARVGAKARLDDFPDHSFGCFASFRDPGDGEGCSDDLDVSFDVSFWVALSPWRRARRSHPTWWDGSAGAVIDLSLWFDLHQNRRVDLDRCAAWLGFG